MHFAETVVIFGNIFARVDGLCSNRRIHGGRAECPAGSFDSRSQRFHSNYRHEHFAADHHAGSIDSVDRDAYYPAADLPGNSQ
jgi:hypothetical protein